MENIADKICSLLAKPENYLRPTEELESSWRKQTKAVYDIGQQLETKNAAASRASAVLPSLIIEGMDTEQVWQQVELQNEEILAAGEEEAAHRAGERNLFFSVVQLKSLLDNGRLSLDLPHQHQTEQTLSNGHDTSEDENTDEDLSDNSADCSESSEAQEESTEEDMNEEDSDDDETPAPKKKRRKEVPKFEKTDLDSGFLSWRECEWQADRNFEMSDEDGDNKEFTNMFFQDESDNEGEFANYDDFFDPPNSGTSNEEVKTETTEPLSKKRRKESTNKENVASDQEELKMELEEDQEKTPLLSGGPVKEVKSTFEKQLELEAEQIATLEQENLSEKAWFLQGEMQADKRPENSTLEEHLDYTIAARQKPIITEDTTTRLERMITSRIRSGAWDDVERKIKPTKDPADYKKKLLLEQEKSKKSLAEIYEEEYLKQQRQQQGDAEPEEEIKEHKDIKSKLKELFANLDALSNYHYTPPMREAEVKVVSNVPSLSLEEATPASVSDAATLAPQEVLESNKGELKGSGEMTKTDKLRARRGKKLRQKQRSQLEQKRLKDKLRKGGANGKLDAVTSAKTVQKAVKSGQVKLLDSSKVGSEKVVRSSEAFFKKLQQGSLETQQNKGKKNKRNPSANSAAKVLL